MRIVLMLMARVLFTLLPLAADALRIPMILAHCFPASELTAADLDVTSVLGLASAALGVTLRALLLLRHQVMRLSNELLLHLRLHHVRLLLILSRLHHARLHHVGLLHVGLLHVGLLHVGLLHVGLLLIWSRVDHLLLSVVATLSVDRDLATAYWHTSRYLIVETTVLLLFHSIYTFYY